MSKPILIATAMTVLATHAVAQQLPVARNGPCPTGWRETSGFCSPGTKDAPRVIPKIAGPCPAGWIASGLSYCTRFDRR
jgi:hypothetical protein